MAEILHARPMANYSCKNFSLTFYPLATIHPLQTDGQTDRWTTTLTTARPLALLKYGRLKSLFPVDIKNNLVVNLVCYRVRQS